MTILSEDMRSEAVRVSLIVAGQKMCPEFISEKLGLKSTKQFVLGKPKDKKHPNVLAKTSFWRLDAEDDTLGVDEQVEMLLVKLSKIDFCIGDLPDVEHAIFYIFVAACDESGEEVSVQTVIPLKNLKRICILGLELSITC